MKTLQVLAVGWGLLLSASCTGKGGALASGDTGTEDSMAVTVGEDGLLRFKQVVFEDSLVADATIYDYSGDEPTSVMGKSMNHYVVHTLQAVGGDPRAVEFINQWLMVDVCVRENDGSAPSVAKAYAQLKQEGVKDVASAAAYACKAFLADVPEDLPFDYCGNTYEETTLVVWNTENLLTLNQTGYDYPAGAAHGMPWDASMTFDLKALRKLALDDIIAAGGQKAVLKMIVAELLKEYADGGLMAADDIGFPGAAPALTKEGVSFYYGAYEVGPYSMGMPVVTLPYGKVQQYLTPEVKELLGK